MASYVNCMCSCAFVGDIWCFRFLELSWCKAYESTVKWNSPLEHEQLELRSEIKHLKTQVQLVKDDLETETLMLKQEIETEIKAYLHQVVTDLQLQSLGTRARGSKTMTHDDGELNSSLKPE